jgi:hypothetical protein
MGKLAGRNMAGAEESYTHIPMFYSDLFEHGYEAVGEISGKMETFIDWQDPFNKGMIYYLQNGRVRGILLWNVWDQIENARTVVAEAGVLQVADLRERLA